MNTCSKDPKTNSYNYPMIKTPQTQKKPNILPKNTHDHITNLTISKKQISYKQIKINNVIQQQYKDKNINQIINTSIKQTMKLYHLQGNIIDEYNQNKSSLIKNKQSIPIYPQSIINILYRQHIKNYNPYIQTLYKLDQIQLSMYQKNNIKRLCFIGIAKDYLQKKKYFLLPHYSRVCILIRMYMVNVMRSIMQEKINHQTQSIYLPINQTALSFNPYQRPKQCQQLITRKKFAQVIMKVNKIIEQEYHLYKNGNFERIKNKLTYSQILMYICLAFIIACVIGIQPDLSQYKSYILFSLILITVFGGMCLAWIQCKKALNKVCQPSNITSKIVQKLKFYFKTISDHNLIWKIGIDFYWIEIQHIHGVKDRFQSGNDNF